MMRNDREVTDSELIDRIINDCYCCRLGFSDEGRVYIVPLSFGYEHIGEMRVFYFHGAAVGKKIDLIKTEGHAGFELDTGYELKEAAEACQHSARYQSVIGAGVTEVVESAEEKLHALRLIMLHNTGKRDWTFSPPLLERVEVFKLEVRSLSCKEHE